MVAQLINFIRSGVFGVPDFIDNSKNLSVLDYWMFYVVAIAVVITISTFISKIRKDDLCETD